MKIQETFFLECCWVVSGQILYPRAELIIIRMDRQKDFEWCSIIPQEIMEIWCSQACNND
jgi:hypothetical protein